MTKKINVDSTNYIVIGLDLFDEAPHHDVTGETTAETVIGV